MKKKLIKTIIFVPLWVISILIFLDNKTISNKPSELVDPKSKEEAKKILTYPEETKESTESVEEKEQ